MLDFGCGTGRLVSVLLRSGHDVRGCDVRPYWQDQSRVPEDRFRLLMNEPYRIPFDDGSFDVVISTSALEHAQNKEELFAEIHRVLVPGGASMHLFPGKWYLPVEPHI